jgi:hypothetical protein
MSNTRDKWEPCMAGYMQERGGIVVIVPTLDYSVTPLFCPICDFPMRTSDDMDCFEKAKCCESCYLRWVEAQPVVWASGWRPTDDELKTYIDMRRKTPPRISSR